VTVRPVISTPSGVVGYRRQSEANLSTDRTIEFTISDIARRWDCINATTAGVDVRARLPDAQGCPLSGVAGAVPVSYRAPVHVEAADASRANRRIRRSC
jgi:hypothetical protein